METKLRIKVDMCGSRNKPLSIQKAKSIAVFVLYALVTSTVNLFHNDQWKFSPPDPDCTDRVFATDVCPACTFLASHNSTGPDYSPLLSDVETVLFTQSPRHLTVVLTSEWFYSALSRAPPSAITS
jgi:hypothetical protein